MPEAQRFVADTNVLLSRLVFRNSIPAQAVRHATDRGKLIVSLEMLEELEDLLFRPKFDSYLTRGERIEFFSILRRTAVWVESIAPISASRDPRDDKFLALAVAGQAAFILTGDADLLVLHPFRDVDILTPRQYLDQQHS